MVCSVNCVRMSQGENNESQFLVFFALEVFKEQCRISSGESCESVFKTVGQFSLWDPPEPYSRNVYGLPLGMNAMHIICQKCLFYCIFFFWLDKGIKHSNEFYVENRWRSQWLV